MHCAGTKEQGRCRWVVGIVSLCWIAQKCNGFVMRPSIIPSRSRVSFSASKTTTSMNALTERQIQFWEDVEDGLAAVGRTIDVRGSDDGLDYQTADEFERIRQFVKSAKGDIPPPKPVADHHDPSEEHVDGLTALPYWDITAEENIKLFPWAQKLEENCGIITEELEKNLADSQSAMFAGDSAWQNNVMGSGWTAVRLQRLGQWNVANCQAFPKTYALLQELEIPLAVRGVCFARQTPQTGVQPHSDGRNFILTTHVALKIPTGLFQLIISPLFYTFYCYSFLIIFVIFEKKTWFLRMLDEGSRTKEGMGGRKVPYIRYFICSFNSE